MQSITIEVSSESDLSLLVQLVKRLGLKVIEGQKKREVKKDLAYHIQVIMAGGDLNQAQLQEMLLWQQENRKDRKLPFRES